MFTISIDCLMNVTPESIKPFTKAAPRKRKSDINRKRTRILTDTPEKQELMSQSDSDEAPPPLLSDEKDCSDRSTTDD
ncbi:unnamed protein product [Clavelina lepadiformis]|uniref:Uncharacterized protein n=1 Tax=Clavelina lepadiformis TaxID=159417 RepID=A0ABP0F916_CLALP